MKGIELICIHDNQVNCLSSAPNDTPNYGKETFATLNAEIYLGSLRVRHEKQRKICILTLFSSNRRPIDCVMRVEN